MPINQTSVWNGSQWITMGGVVDTASNYNWAGSHNFAQSAIFQDDVKVKSINNGPIAGFRNNIINGGFNVWQRGTSISGAAHNTYTADQWININDNIGNINISQIDIASQGIGLRYAARVEKTTGASNRFVFINLSEGALNYVGKQVTLSFWLRKGSALTSGITATIGTRVNKYGTVYDYGDFGILNSQINTSTFTKFSTTFTITSATANASANLFELEFTAIQAGGTGVYFEVAGVQLEVGSSATPFENRHYGAELALCQRYYYRQYANANGGGYNMLAEQGMAGSTTNAWFSVKFPVVMRTAPSLEYNTTYSVYALQQWSATIAISAITGDVQTMDRGVFYVTASGLTQYRPYSFISAPGTTGAYLGWSSEI